jgi:hypothetical protein
MAFRSANDCLFGTEPVIDRGQEHLWSAGEPVGALGVGPVQEQNAYFVHLPQEL